MRLRLKHSLVISSLPNFSCFQESCLMHHCECYWISKSLPQMQKLKPGRSEHNSCAGSRWLCVWMLLLRRLESSPAILWLWGVLCLSAQGLALDTYLDAVLPRHFVSDIANSLISLQHCLTAKSRAKRLELKMTYRISLVWTQTWDWVWFMIGAWSAKL